MRRGDAKSIRSKKAYPKKLLRRVSPGGSIAPSSADVIARGIASSNVCYRILNRMSQVTR